MCGYKGGKANSTGKCQSSHNIGIISQSALKDFPPNTESLLRHRMTVYVVRHGETDWNIIKRLQGHLDVPLNDTGRMQARKLGEYLKEHPQEYNITRIVSSDLTRCMETASLINVNKLPIEYTNTLRERHMGPVEGMLLAEAKKIFGDQFKQQGETEQEMLARVTCKIDEICATSAPGGGDTLVVTHGGVIRALGGHYPLAATAKKGTAERVGGRVGNTSITALERGEIIFYAERPHLVFEEKAGLIPEEIDDGYR